MMSSDSLIEMISRHIVESDMLVSKQIRLIQRLRSFGLSTADAEGFLCQFQCDLARRYDVFKQLME